MPAPSVQASTVDPDKTSVPIRSARKQPEKVELDAKGPAIEKSSIPVTVESGIHSRDAFETVPSPEVKLTQVKATPDVTEQATSGWE